MTVDQAAIFVRLLVEISHGWQAKVGETVPKFCEVFLAQHLRFSIIRTPSHAGDFTIFALSSPCNFVLR